MVTYHVGSRNEVTGTTGSTHLLEHLMFKGSVNYNRDKGNSVDQLLSRTGAQFNATTYLDRTNYYENLGSDQLAMVVGMEADRMRNLLLRESDRRPEMTVVRNEFERGENNPIQSLIKEIFAAAYVAHPYHHNTIGWRSDIEKVTIEKLREFYDTFYWPDNATVTLVGDFQSAEALGLIKQHYGVITRAPRPIPQVYTEEPEQTGPRRVVVKRPGQLGVIAIAHKSPAATHPDFPALAILGSILGDGKNSRLYRELTDKNLSTGVFTGPFALRDPSLHFTFIPLAPGASHEQVEKIAVDEVEKLKQHGVTATEVQAAIAKALADSAYQRDGSFAIAGKINEFIAAGDWTLYVTLDEALQQVTPADVLRVANKYLNVDQSTTGWFIPQTPAAPAVATKSSAK
jgi:zinc protease